MMLTGIMIPTLSKMLYLIYFATIIAAINTEKLQDDSKSEVEPTPNLYTNITFGEEMVNGTATLAKDEDDIEKALKTNLQSKEEYSQLLEKAINSIHSSESDLDDFLNALSDLELKELLEAANESKENYDGDIDLSREQIIKLIRLLELLESSKEIKLSGSINNVEMHSQEEKVVEEELVEHKPIENKMKEIKQKHERVQDPAKHRVKRKMLRRFKSNETWTFPINYYISPGFFFSNAKKLIRDNLQVWEDQTCASFNEVFLPTKSPGIIFKNGKGCNSITGKTSEVAMREIVLELPNCFLPGTIQHEIGHALGLVHEHARPDRDSYVTIYNSRILPGANVNYVSFNWFESLTENVEYDYTSAMQYGGTHMGNREGTVVMKAKFEEYQKTMGQRMGLSFLDVKIFNYQYCRERCPGYDTLEWSECQHGGYRNPLNCSVCRCIDGWSGAKCENLEPSSEGVTPHLRKRQTISNAVCGGTFSADPSSKSLLSPGYPLPGYKRHATCTWLLQAPFGRRVSARVVGDFETACSVVNSTICDHDWFEIRYTNLGYPGPRFCCTEGPNKAFVSIGNEMMIILKSNNVFVGKGKRTGFKLEYSSIEGDGVVPCKALKLKNVDNSQQKWRQGIYKKLSIPWNSKPVYKHIIEPLFLYHRSGTWLFGAVVGGVSAGMKVLSNAASPDKVTETWKSFSSGNWISEPRLSLTCDDICDSIWLSGISKQSTYGYLNGAYALFQMDNNGAPVYKKRTSSNGDVTLSMIGRNKWQFKSDSHTLVSPFITTETNPAKIPNAWLIGNKKIKIECYFGTIPCDSILVTGIKNYQSLRNGLYFLEGSLFNGRPVYTHETGKHFMYYGIFGEGIRYWFIGRDMKGSVGVRVSDTAMVPENIMADTWELFDGINLQWKTVKTVSADCVNLDITPCQKLFISGSALQRARQGVYVLRAGSLNHRPVYMHESGDSFLYISSNVDGWAIGPAIGGSSFGAYVRDRAILPYDVTSTWKMFNGFGFVDDSKWTVVCFKAPTPCAKILFGSSPSQTARQGLYFLEPKTFNHRPVYKHEFGDDYMFYSASSGMWFIGSSIGTSLVGIYRNTRLPTPQAIGTPWSVFAGRSWSLAPTLKAKCITGRTSCRRLLVSGFGGTRAQFNGQYAITGSVFNYRASYKHTSRRLYMYYKFGHWLIGTILNGNSASSDLLIDKMLFP
ncbi:unnamed protein product [Owenia fusiformis]|uniref:Metalloendopeptidase n=1 Tax=Owenia fusiformis TaxID=6347 RepID=A0A8S4NHK8_OWEFU|nr:unnamed protein product [Owenia fusiformis]